MTGTVGLTKRRLWSDQCIADLARLCGEGLTHSQIAKQMGRSHAAVQLKASKLGLSNGVPLGGGLSASSQLRSSSMSARSLDYGTAAELIVCADIILLGHRAFMSSAGYAYDVVADINGRLLRVGVKGSHRATARPGREAGRICYQFSIARSGRNKSNKCGRYTVDDCDMIALVALDVRQVVYVAPRGRTFVTAFHVDPPDAPIPDHSRNGMRRKHWSNYSLASALAEIDGAH